MADDFKCDFCDGRVIHKDISLEEHVSHAASHLGRAQRHLGTAQEHHAALGNMAGLTKADAAEHNPHTLHHLFKAGVHIGRADEQQKMAVRHLNALTGNSQYGENQTYKGAERATHESGQHLMGAEDNLDQLNYHAVPAPGETATDAQARVKNAAAYHQAAGEHLAGALQKLDEAKGGLDASLSPVEAQQKGDPAGMQEPAQKALTIAVSNDVPAENLLVYKAASGVTAFRLFVPIQQMEKAEMATDVKDSSGDAIKVPGLIVRGWGSVSEYKDSQGDIITGEALIDAVKGKDNPDAFAKWGNIREMHKAEAIGNAPIVDIREHPITKSPALWVEAFIVDDRAINKFLTKTYKGFSIGGQCLEAEPLAEAA